MLSLLALSRFLRVATLSKMTTCFGVDLLSTDGPFHNVIKIKPPLGVLAGGRRFSAVWVGFCP